jgi:hypothetical protein
MSIYQLDILSIDAQIKEEFSKEYEKIDEYKKKIDDFKETCKKKNLSIRSINTLTENTNNLEKNLKEIVSNEKLYFYIAETSDLIQQYKKILQTPIKVTFMGGRQKNNKEKNKVIRDYLKIAQNYIILDIDLNMKNKKIECNNCPNNLLFDIIDESIYICISCGSQQEILLHTSSYKDIDRINISAKYTYDRKVHFRDCINQYQGKQNSTINSEVFIKLEDQFYRHHLLIGDKDTDKNIRFSKIEKEHIHLFLKELDYTKHYENINLIHYHMTGKKPDDISHLEDKLLDDFDELTELYDRKFKNKPGFNRKNFINTQYVLYQFLLRYRHPCNKDNFTILKTVDRKSFHDDIAKKCFEELGWNHSPLF